MALKKLTDWRGWWDGLRSKAMKAGGESLSTGIGALLTTNGLAGMKVPGCEDIGMGWKTALISMFVQFALRVALAAAQYVAAKPDPDTITVDTTFTSRSADGSSVNQSSSTTISTPPPANAQMKPTPGDCQSAGLQAGGDAGK
jgi:hypothetical protein